MFDFVNAANISSCVRHTNSESKLEICYMNFSKLDIVPSQRCLSVVKSNHGWGCSTVAECWPLNLDVLGSKSLGYIYV